MFGFKKKEQKPLWIMGKEVMEIIRSDYGKRGNGDHTIGL